MTNHVSILACVGVIGVGLLSSLPAWADTSKCETYDLHANFGSQNFAAGADQNVTGAGFGESLAEGQMFNCSKANIGFTTSGAIQANPTVHGVTFNDAGVQHAVFSTGIPGIGYAVGISDRRGTEYQPLLADQPTITYQGPGNAKTLGYKLKVNFVFTDRLVSGQYRLSNKDLASFFGITAAGDRLGSPRFTVNATFNITARTCAVNSGSVIGALELPLVSSRDFEGVASGGNAGQPSNEFNIEVRCEGGVNVWASVSDGLAPANTSNVLTLAQDRMAATGVGLQMFRRGSSTPLQFGPDTSDAGRAGAWYVGTASGQGGVMSTKLYARYVRTGDRLKGGQVSGVATLTFSYR